MFDLFSFQQDGLAAPEVDIGRREVAQALVVAVIIVVADEGLDLCLQVARQIVIFQKDAVLQGLMPTLDLALGLRMIGIQASGRLLRGAQQLICRGGPVRYFVLSNGLETNIYEPGKEQPALALGFKLEGNTNYRQLKEMLQPMAFSKSRSKPDTQKTIHFSKPSIAEVNHVFAKCHQHIHQSDKISQAKGFEEFVKPITLKLLSDNAKASS